MREKKRKETATRLYTKDKLSIEELARLSGSRYFSETDLCGAFHSIDNNTPKKIIEFLFNQSVALGRPDYALEICHFLDSEITEHQANKIMENALKIGRTAQAIDAAIIGISEEMLDKLISYLADCHHIWIIYEYERVISRNEPNRFSNEEKDFYLNLIKKTKETAALRLESAANRSNKKNIYFIIKEWAKKFF